MANHILSWREIQLISRLCPGLLDDPGRKLEDRVRQQAQGQTPGPHYSSNFADSVLAIEVQNINRELHKPRMDPFARNNPQRVAIRQIVASEQAVTPLCGGISDLRRIS
jgi:hypothetical protein